ncbi:hypothetical protein V6N13_025432 [Hibiscus sabdariffa]
MRLCSFDESPKEPEEVAKTPTNAKNKRKRKKTVEATSERDEIRKALARMVIVDELPFSFVEREGFRHFCKIAVPSFVPPSRATITRDCYALFIEKGKKLKNYFSNLSSRARSLSFNLYSSGHDEESLLALENMEEEMQDLTLEQPTIIINETSEVPELFL